MVAYQEEGDWEVTAEGLHIATRGFLIRRGYCCANRCRNCPYINWRNDPTWRPVPPECVRRTRVSPRTIGGAATLLQAHESQFAACSGTEKEYHRAMIAHYRRLLEHWRR